MPDKKMDEVLRLDIMQSQMNVEPIKTTMAYKKQLSLTTLNQHMITNTYVWANDDCEIMYGVS